jgi:hypothetical protein
MPPNNNSNNSNNNGQISPQIESPLPNAEPTIKIESTSSSSLLESNTNNISTPPPSLPTPLPTSMSNGGLQQLSASNNNGNGFIPQLAFGNLYIQNPPPPPPPPPLSASAHHLAQQQHSNQFYHQQLLNSASTSTTTPTPTTLNNNLNSSRNSSSSSNTNGGGGIMLYPGSSSSSSSSNSSTTDIHHNNSNGLNHQNGGGVQRRLTQDWQGTYPSQSTFPNNSTTSTSASTSSSSILLNTQSSSDSTWLIEEYPEIDIHTPLPEYWCTINYFEGDLQVGDLFKVRSNYCSVTIDGFFDSSREDRFCLGALTNVQRTSASEKSRPYIGKGVQLENQLDGSVFVRCHSDYSVFFESYYLDRESGREAFDAVHKIYPGSRVKVFSLRECLRCLKMAATMQQQQNNQTNGSMLNGISNGGGGSNQPINVDDLRRLCRLRFSFVKGWGPDYPRKTILETPCWCEIQLNRPLQYLDQLINGLSVVNLNNNSNGTNNSNNANNPSNFLIYFLIYLQLKIKKFNFFVIDYID